MKPPRRNDDSSLTGGKNGRAQERTGGTYEEESKVRTEMC